RGRRRARRVMVARRPLPFVIDPVESAADELLLFPEAGTNTAVTLAFGRDESLFDGCEVVVRRRIVNQRVAPCPLEGRASAAAWGDDGRLTHWASTQSAHSTRDMVANRLGLDNAQVHVIAPDVGGGFGAKIGNYPEELILGWV